MVLELSLLNYEHPGLVTRMTWSCCESWSMKTPWSLISLRCLTNINKSCLKPILRSLIEFNTKTCPVLLGCTRLQEVLILYCYSFFFVSGNPGFFCGNYTIFLLEKATQSRSFHRSIVIQIAIDRCLYYT